MDGEGEGTPFGRYRLLSLLGEGGMGEVWRAHDTVIDRVVAIKVLSAKLSKDEEFQRRFRREAHGAARLNTPHVVPIYDYGEIDGQLFVCMRLIEGRDLAAVLADGPLEPARAVRIIGQVAEALHAAHGIGLIHRDIKPSNILLDDRDFAYLIDFGIARVADDTRMTKTGNTIGTFAYIAPERLSLEGEEDARVDIYSLACVLYECLTGQPPFNADTMPRLMMAHLQAPPPRPSITRPDVPVQVDEVIATGMAKDPDQRYATTIELADAARDAITRPIAPLAPNPTRIPETQPAHHVVTDQLATANAASPPPVKPAPPAQPAPPTPARAGSISRGTIALIAAVIALVAVVAAVVGISALSKHEPSESSPTSSASMTPSSSQTTPTPAASKSEVRVYNISEVAGLAGRTADQLKAGGFNATVGGQLVAPPDVAVTTVFFGDTPGEREAAKAVGQLLGAPVVPRIPAVVDQPPGVIVLVTG